jgi:hypothetical protein
MVAIRGVLNLSLTVARNLKIRPSLAIAYITRGNGNIAPKRLKRKLKEDCYFMHC